MVNFGTNGICDITIRCDAAGHKKTDRLSELLCQWAQEENLSVRTTVQMMSDQTLQSGDRVMYLADRDLRYLTSDGHYCLLHCTAGTSRIRLSFREAVLQLAAADDSPYLVINRGILVNAAHIAGHTSTAFVLDDGTSLPIRRADRQRLIRAYDSGSLSRTPP